MARASEPSDRWPSAVGVALRSTYARYAFARAPCPRTVSGRSARLDSSAVSERAPLAGGIDRRTFLGGAALALLWPARAFGADEPSRAALAPATRRLLETSPFVYVSPLRSDGTESTCHGEVWFFWDDGSVVVNSRRGTWKVRALERGLDRARIWVGDHGRWKGFLPGTGTNEDFRQAPSFEARARFETDRDVLSRLLAAYDEKYAGEFRTWREDMQTGFYSGKRKLIRYVPVGEG